jgi:hypothetical protein
MEIRPMSRLLLPFVVWLLLCAAAQAQTVYGSYSWDHHTEAAATPILEVVPPVTGKKVRVTSTVYTPAATVHDIVFMRTIATVELTAASAASDTTLDLSAATFGGDTLASGDYVILEHGDGTYGAYLASNLATLVLTVNAISKAANVGANVYIMGAPGDTSYHNTVKSIASTRTEFIDPVGGVMDGDYDIGTYSSDGLGLPVLIYSANGTNAGVMNWGSAIYVRE